jgi:hypothetical protein
MKPLAPVTITVSPFVVPLAISGVPGSFTHAGDKMSRERKERERRTV